MDNEKKQKEAHKLFNKYTKQVIAHLGRRATTDAQLSALCKKLFNGKPKYVGTFSQDYKPKKSPIKQYFIINTDTSDKPGQHWVAVYKSNNTFYIYDSYARSSKRLLPVFSKKVGLSNIIDSDTSHHEQLDNTEICGCLCVAWLMIIHHHGIRQALLI